MCFPDCFNEKFITALIKRSNLLGKNCQQMSKNLLKIKKSSTAMAIFQSRQCLFMSSHFVDKKTRTVLFSFPVFRYRSYPYTKTRAALFLFPVFRYRSYPYTKTQAALFCFWYFAIAHTTAQTSAHKACLFYIRFSRCAKHSLNVYKKLSAHNVCTQRSLWSE